MLYISLLKLQEEKCKKIEKKMKIDACKHLKQTYITELQKRSKSYGMEVLKIADVAGGWMDTGQARTTKRNLYLKFTKKVKFKR